MIISEKGQRKSAHNFWSIHTMTSHGHDFLELNIRLELLQKHRFWQFSVYVVCIIEFIAIIHCTDTNDNESAYQLQFAMIDFQTA